MRSAIVAALLVLLLPALVLTQVPQKMSYQGLLTTTTGTPVQDGNYDLKLDLYNAPAGGTLRFTQTLSGVPVDRGTFSVLLGPLPAVFTESLFVEVTILSGPGIGSPLTFAPRTELTSAPYALHAHLSDTAEYARATPSPSQWITSGSSITYSTGNVGIGTTTPDADARLDVNGYAFGKAPVVVYDSATGSGTYFDISWLRGIRTDNVLVEKQTNNIDFRLKKAGLYRISFFLYFTSSNSGQYELEVHKNGALEKIVGFWTASPCECYMTTGSVVVQSDGDDLFRFKAYSYNSDIFELYVYVATQMSQQLSIEYLGAQ